MPSAKHETPSLYPRMMAFVVFLYLATKIFYLFPSGYPQIADAVFFIAIIAMVLRWLVTPKWRIDLVFFTALVFAALTVTINGLYFIFYKDSRLLLSSFYYIYNALIFIFVVSGLRENPAPFSKALYAGIVVSIFAELFVCLAFPETSNHRGLGTFNNPNQLANWGLSSLGILFVLKHSERLKIFDLLLIVIVGYIQTLALSKAGMICFLLMMMGLCFTRKIDKTVRFLVLFGASVTLLVLAFSYTTTNAPNEDKSFLNRSIARLQNIGDEKDDSLEGRKYDRLIKYPYYLLSGAGEGAYDRFADNGRDVEMHSGLGTILFSYGILGFAVFLYLLFKITKRAPPFFTVILGTLLLYSLTHQSIRSSYFWIFLGAGYAFAIRQEREENETAP